MGRGAGYTADSLALLTGRKRAYGYRYTEAFLSQVAYADGADSFTSALAWWSTRVFHPPQALAEDTAQPHTLTRLLSMGIVSPSTVTCFSRAD